MYAAGMPARGVMRKYFFPHKTKPDQNFFINKILKPVMEKDIPRLYSKEKERTSSSILIRLPVTLLPRFTRTSKVKCISKKDWPSNSPDLSPMDFSGNGTFRKAMFARKPETIAGLQKIAREVWKEFPETICYNTMKTWPRRVQKMLRNNSFQIRKYEKNKFVCFRW